MKSLAMPSQLADNSTCVGHGLSDASLLLARDAIPLSSRYSDSRSGITSESTAFSFIYNTNNICRLTNAPANGTLR